MHSLPLPLAAFLAGILSFLSPCVLPLVPGYVSLISGATVEDLQSEDRRMLGTVMLHSLTFILGFSVVFIALGAVATSIGQLANEYHHILAKVAGVIVIIFGLHLTGLLKIKALYADKRLHDVKGSSSAWGSFAVGFAFAFGWTPCIGPILATILVFAGAQETLFKGVFLLAVYSLGLGRTVFVDLARRRSFPGLLRQIPSPSSYRRSHQRCLADRSRSDHLHEQSEAAFRLSGFFEPVCAIENGKL